MQLIEQQLASHTPCTISSERCAQLYHTLLTEVDRRNITLPPRPKAWCDSPASLLHLYKLVSNDSPKQCRTMLSTAFTTRIDAPNTTANTQSCCLTQADEVLEASMSDQDWRELQAQTALLNRIENDPSTVPIAQAVPVTAVPAPFALAPSTQTSLLHRRSTFERQHMNLCHRLVSTLWVCLLHPVYTELSIWWSSWIHILGTHTTTSFIGSVMWSTVSRNFGKMLVHHANCTAIGVQNSAVHLPSIASKTVSAFSIQPLIQHSAMASLNEKIRA